MRVADLFCGPGGISEGLQQAGFDIVFGLDANRAAADTFAFNHPNAEVVHTDAAGFTPEDIPDFDILVGGPPCVNFSSSKGGRRNILEGLRLVHIFLRAVYERQPKYWIMENVPRIALHLPETIPLSWIGIDKKGELHVPRRLELNTADYGVPQLRRRYLIGQFPEPKPTHHKPDEGGLFASLDDLNEWRILQEVLTSLPDPLNGGNGDGNRVVDPNYGFSLPIKHLSDHFHDVVLSSEEVRKIRGDKLEHPFMGNMAFPDQLDRPARTVVATQLGRETLVLTGKQNGKLVYRRATVRECATIQTFPISFQFFGNSLAARYRQAGDAVPPKLSYAIAKAIREREGIQELSNPIVQQEVLTISPPVKTRRSKVPGPLPLDKRFRQMIPGKEVRGCRVEFDNQGEEPTQAIDLPEGTRNLVRWVSRLYVGEGKANLRSRVFSFEEAVSEMIGAFDANLCSLGRFKAFLGESYEELLEICCDATTLQAVRARRASGPPGPFEIGDLICSIVDKHFPKDEFSKLFVPRSGRFVIIPRRGLRFRIAAGLVITAFACELINSDARWVGKHQDLRFVPEDWENGMAERVPGKVLSDPCTQLEGLLNQRRELSPVQISRATG